MVREILYLYVLKHKKQKSVVYSMSKRERLRSIRRRKKSVYVRMCEMGDVIDLSLCVKLQFVLLFIPNIKKQINVFRLSRKECRLEILKLPSGGSVKQII